MLSGFRLQFSILRVQAAERRVEVVIVIREPCADVFSRRFCSAFCYECCDCAIFSPASLVEVSVKLGRRPDRLRPGRAHHRHVIVPCFPLVFGVCRESHGPGRIWHLHFLVDMLPIVRTFRPRNPREGEMLTFLIVEVNSATCGDRILRPDIHGHDKHGATFDAETILIPLHARLPCDIRCYTPEQAAGFSRMDDLSIPNVAVLILILRRVAAPVPRRFVPRLKIAVLHQIV